MPARESPRRPRPANSFARRFITFARASTARARPSRPSPSACRRLDGPGSSSLRREGARHRPRRVAPRRRLSRRVDAALLPPGVVRVASAAHSNERVIAPPRLPLSRGRRNPPRDDAQALSDPRLLGRRPGRKARRGAPPRRGRRHELESVTRDSGEMCRFENRLHQ